MIRPFRFSTRHNPIKFRILRDGKKRKHTHTHGRRSVARRDLAKGHISHFVSGHTLASCVCFIGGASRRTRAGLWIEILAWPGRNLARNHLLSAESCSGDVQMMHHGVKYREHRLRIDCQQDATIGRDTTAMGPVNRTRK